ncbi:hypothetical protein NHQ30_005292 [Ciborinia camelliae]|nr:hypothetical protein NHQ30_005292 [Ciborinia camelliae]
MSYNTPCNVKPRWIPLKTGFAFGFFVIGIATTIGVQKFAATRRLNFSSHGDIKNESTENEHDMARGRPCSSKQRTRGGFGGFTSLKLISAQDVNHNTKRLRFEVPDANSLGTFKLCSVLLTFHKPTDALLPVIRPYTPIQDFNDPHHIDLLVKKYPNGKSSTYLHSLRPGDSLKVRGPMHPYTWKPNEAKYLNLIAGGSGITPMYQLIQGILQNPEEKTKIKLIFAVNEERDMVLKEELKGFEERFPDRFKMAWVVSRPTDMGEDSSFYRGYVNKEILAKELVGFEPQSGKVESMVFVCGPTAMEDLLAGKRGWMWNQKGLLQELGYNRNEVVR